MEPNIEQDLGRRMQEEHKALHQLIQVLKEHLITPTGSNAGQWLDALRAAFERLRAHIERTITIKEQGGYLATVLRVRPTLSKQVAAIKSENSQLVRLANDIAHDLNETRPDDRLLVADISARIQRFMAVVSQHEQRENMIALFAFNQDLGGD